MASDDSEVTDLTGTDDNETTEEENEEPPSQERSKSDVQGTVSYDLIRTLYGTPMATPEDWQPGDEYVGEVGDYKPSKKENYVSGLSRFAWMKTPQVVIEENIELTREMIQYCLSRIGRAIDSTEMVYLKFEARDKRLRDIDALSKFAHLRNVDLTDNHIVNLNALAPMKHLQVLNVGGNQISSFEDIPQFLWLQALNLSRNELVTLEGIHSNYLTYLNLSNNHINSMSFFLGEFFPNLLLLELRGNDISSMAGMELPKLRHLYIAQNLLTDLDGLECCPELEFIHARDNLITSLVNFPNLEKLKYINLRNNTIRRFTQMIQLGNSEGIETVVMMENPICESERYRSEIMASVLSIKRLDKTLVSEIERVDGQELRTARKMNLIPPMEDDYTVATPPGQYEVPGEGNDE